MTTQQNGGGAADPATTPATPEPVAPASPAAPANPPVALDDKGDWIAASPLDDNQKAWIKRAIDQSFARKDEVKELRGKVAEYETAAKDAQRKLDEENGNYKKISDETTAELSALKRRILNSEVKVHAVKEKMVDPSLLDHLPLDGVAMDDTGAVSGVDTFIAKLKADKPYLFEAAPTPVPQATTTPTPTPAPAGKTSPRNALEMTDEEYKEARAAELKKK